MDIKEKIKQYGDKNAEIVNTMQQIDAEMKRLSELKQKLINEAITNNGAIQALTELEKELGNVEQAIISNKNDNVIEMPKEQKKKDK